MDFDWLFYNATTYDLASFVSALFAEVRIYYDSNICFGVGYSISTITFSIKFTQSF